MTAKTFTARAKAFSNEGVRDYQFMIDGNDLLVWDSVAGHFTSCHSISASTARRLRKLAAA